ncbi:MAG: LysR family transcriptional regulator [Verrucomicrobia bacterium]|nr:LysR family transcriptional regulator [Verrucomicrobiota bacterium]
MNVEYFRVFRDLVDSNSFSRSAAINGITQSAVSQQLKTLEQRLDVTLLERNNKKFILTQEGQLLYSACLNIIGHYQRFLDELGALRDVISGTIRLVAVPSLGLHELPSSIKGFLRAFPDVKIQIDYRRSSEVYESVATADADLGFVAFPSAHRGLTVDIFRQDALHIVCAPGHPFLQMAPIPLPDLAQTKILSLGPEIPTRQGLDLILASRGLVVEPAMEFDNVETLKQAVEIDAGVAFLPQSVIAAELAAGTLAILPHQGPEILRPLGIISRTNQIISPAVGRFLMMLKTPHDPLKNLTPDSNISSQDLTTESPLGTE